MKKSLVVTATTILAATLLMATPAVAATRPTIGFRTPSTVAGGLIQPLSFGVDGNGDIYTRQALEPQRVTRITPGGAVSDVALAHVDNCPLAQACPEISAVSVRRGTMYYSVNVFDPDYVQEGFVHNEIRSVSPSGSDHLITDLVFYEGTNNPDGATTYGFLGLPEACAAQFEREAPATYTGPRESHPAASVATAQGLYIADSAANAIFRVGYDGSVSTVAVLPPVVMKTEPGTSYPDAPPCAGAYDYRSEPSPTDVAIRPDGQLYVITSPRRGGDGGIWLVNPSSGVLTKVATGISGATGIAVAPKSGVVFVAQEAGGPNGTGQVSALLPGASRPSFSVAVANPRSVELQGSSLYVSVNAGSFHGTAKIIKVPLIPTIGW